VLRERESVLADLRRYRDEYLSSSRMRANGVSIVAFQDYQALSSDVSTRRSRTSHASSRGAAPYDARRNEWLTVRSRAASLEKAVERCLKVEQRHDR
jgi:flagellar biosynthesis chaperone FliJ